MALCVDMYFISWLYSRCGEPTCSNFELVNFKDLEAPSHSHQWPARQLWLETTNIKNIQGTNKPACTLDDKDFADIRGAQTAG